nr:protein-L-isoaspartate(D-aspartate) O-methyltransferase [Anaerolineae bacterium]
MSESDLEKRFTEARQKMVRQQVKRRGITHPLVLAAMETVPRHHFISPDLQYAAYDDGPLPIGSRQTISQPYIVALMTQLLNPEPDFRVLDVGTGSGYQAAILAEIVNEVIGIERIPELAEQAKERLQRLGYQNVTVHIADGSMGYAPDAPYDGIVVGAAAPAVPEPLIMQLAIGGRMIIPVGSSFEQVIQRVTRKSGSEIQVEYLTPVRFVPLIGKKGYDRDWL